MKQEPQGRGGGGGSACSTVSSERLLTLLPACAPWLQCSRDQNDLALSRPQRYPIFRQVTALPKTQLPACFFSHQ